MSDVLLVYTLCICLAYGRYQTLFSEFPRALVLRILDILFYEGPKILFRVAIAMLQIREKEVLFNLHSYLIP